MIDKQLRQYILTEIVTRYDSFDAAHRRDHALGVMERSLQLAAHYPETDLNMVYTLAAYHDVGLCEGRELHHIASGRILLSDNNLLRWFGPEQLRIMAEAVEDHRASSAHPPRTIYGKIVAEADRQIVPEVVMRRTVQYGLAHYPHLSPEEHYARFCAHLREKYDYGGYLKLYIPESDNALQLERLRRLIARPDLLREAFERLFAELTQQ